MAGNRKTGTERYRPQPVDVDGLRDKVTIGRYRRGPQDQTWTVTVTLSDGSKKVVSAGVCSEVQASFKAAQLYSRFATMAEAGIDTKPIAAVCAPTFGDAAKIAVERLTEAYEATKRAEGGGKAHKHNTKRSTINTVLLPAFETVAWPDMAAKAAAWNSTVRLANGAKPAQSSMVNYNAALQYVNKIASEKGWLSGNKRDFPRLSRSDFRKTERQAAFSASDIQRMSEIMDDDWAAQSNTHRIFRAWCCVLASAGIRPGQEAERIRESHVEIMKEGVFITIWPMQGKYKKGRRAAARFNGFGEIPPRYILEDLFYWRNTNWKNKTDINEASIFANPKTGAIPELHKFFRQFIKDHNMLIDINTSKEFVPYSFRHYAISASLRDNKPIAMIARVFGTSVEMIEKHYSDLSDMEAAQSMVGVDEDLIRFAAAMKRKRANEAK